MQKDLKDADIESVLKSYMTEDKAEPESPAVNPAAYERKVVVVGGDYFSQEAYDRVRSSDDHVFSRYAAKAKSERPAADAEQSASFDLYTETLAQIYAEQGYFEQAKEIYYDLCSDFMCEYDEAGSIGKRYRRQDEIGTPFCVVYDFESVEDGCVTVRDRDTMESVRMPIGEVKGYIAERLKF